MNKDRVKIVAKSISRIMPRFKEKKYVDEPADVFGSTTERIEKDLMTNEYPLSYLLNQSASRDRVLTALNDMQILYSNGEQISNKLDLEYDTTSNLRWGYLTINPVGYIEYSKPVDKIDGSSAYYTFKSSQYSYSLPVRYYDYRTQTDLIDFSVPIIDIGTDIDLIKSFGNGWGYGNDLYYPAGWGQVVYQDKGINSDYTLKNIIDDNDLVYEFNDILYVDPSTVQESSLTYIDELEGPMGRYATVDILALKSNLLFIQDGPERLLKIENGDTYYTYTIGNLINNDFVPKTIYNNVPCEYGEVDGEYTITS